MANYLDVTEENYMRINNSYCVSLCSNLPPRTKEGIVRTTNYLLLAARVFCRMAYKDTLTDKYKSIRQEADGIKIDLCCDTIEQLFNIDTKNSTLDSIQTKTRRISKVRLNKAFSEIGQLILVKMKYDTPTTTGIQTLFSNVEYNKRTKVYTVTVPSKAIEILEECKTGYSILPILPTFILNNLENKVYAFICRNSTVIDNRVWKVNNQEVPYTGHKLEDIAEFLGLDCKDLRECARKIIDTVDILNKKLGTDLIVERVYDGKKLSRLDFKFGGERVGLLV